MRESVSLKKNKLLKKENLLSDIIENYDWFDHKKPKIYNKFLATSTS